MGLTVEPHESVVNHSTSWQVPCRELGSADVWTCQSLGGAIRWLGSALSAISGSALVRPCMGPLVIFFFFFAHGGSHESCIVMRDEQSHG